MGLDRHSGRCTLHAHSCYPGTLYEAESTETPLDLKSLLGLLSQRQTPAVQSTLFDASHSFKKGAASVRSSVDVLLLVASLLWRSSRSRVCTFQLVTS